MAAGDHGECPATSADEPSATENGDEQRPFHGQVPEHFNLAVDVCGRWAGERGRLALYCEEAGGRRAAYSFWDIQQQANRLSNVLAALGTLPGDRVAVSLPQSVEYAIALVAVCQMGALLVPLPRRMAPPLIVRRLRDTGAHILIAAAAGLDAVQSVRRELDALRHLIGVGCGLAGDVCRWSAVLEHASPRYSPRRTLAADAAMIVGPDGDDEKTPGTVLAHRTLFGAVSRFLEGHAQFPLAGDLVWSPADWAGNPGLWGVVLPTWHFGAPLLAYDGHVDACQALTLLDRYGVRNALLPTALLRAMMNQSVAPQATHDLDLRTVVSVDGEVADDVARWTLETFGARLSRGSMERWLAK